MSRVKTILKKCPSLYHSLQNAYHVFRGIIETHILGSKIQERYWKNRKLKWRQDCLGLESISHPHRQLLIEKIVTYIPFSSILEIGCASGPNLILLAPKFPNVKIRGLDINPRAVEIGNEYFNKKGASNVKLLVGKADDLRQFQDKSFDIVFTDATLLYIGPDKIKKVASEMQRITRKAIILLEHHSEEESALGRYNKGNWLRNYKALFYSFARRIETTKISPELWGGDWGRLGYLIEILLRKR